MKAVGLAVCAVAVPVSAAKPKGSVLDKCGVMQMNGDFTVPTCDISTIAEPCEGSFVAEYDPYTRRYATQVDMSSDDYFNLQEQSQTLNSDRFSFFTDSDKRSGFCADEGYLMFNSLSAVLVGKDRYRATLIIDYKEVQVGFGTIGWNKFVVSNTGGLVEVEMYRKISFKEILSRNLVWTEIKEN